jgi:hypothetical protein
MNTFNLIVLSILSLILTITTLEFSFSENRQEPDQPISVTDSLQEEEEDVYDGDEKQDEAQDEEQNEFVGGSEEDELDSELSHDEQEVESQEQTENEIDAIEEDINEQP